MYVATKGEGGLRLICWEGHEELSRRCCRCIRRDRVKLALAITCIPGSGVCALTTPGCLPCPVHPSELAEHAKQTYPAHTPNTPRHQTFTSANPAQDNSDISQACLTYWKAFPNQIKIGTLTLMSARGASACGMHPHCQLGIPSPKQKPVTNPSVCIDPCVAYSLRLSVVAWWTMLSDMCHCTNTRCSGLLPGLT